LNDEKLIYSTTPIFGNTMKARGVATTKNGSMDVRLHSTE
jgi:hypothetical protein